MPHTPGPWENEDGEITARGAVVANVYQADDFPCLDDADRPAAEEECKANARLIAAAPDLLEACRSALVPVKEAWAKQMEGNDLWPVFEALRAAVARAEGEED